MLRVFVLDELPLALNVPPWQIARAQLRAQLRRLNTLPEHLEFVINNSPCSGLSERGSLSFTNCLDIQSSFLTNSASFGAKFLALFWTHSSRTSCLICLVTWPHFGVHS